ncbi:MAG: DUF2500 domain-containing protein [Clostridia bacterium]|nr:DUF2500 domain-containing protein [Clostridia bacterium]
MIDIFPIIFGLFFTIFLVVFIYNVVMNIRQWHKNNQSPRLSVDATVVTKRSHTSHNHHHHNGHMHTASSTSYYVTFQVQSGDRMELRVKSYDYGMMVEGDYGVLTFQGTRFLGFERKYNG